MAETEWLNRKITVAELEEMAADPENGKVGKDYVERLKALLREGDELWWLETAGGVNVVRDGKTQFFLEMNFIDCGAFGGVDDDREPPRDY